MGSRNYLVFRERVIELLRLQGVSENKVALLMGGVDKLNSKELDDIIEKIVLWTNWSNLETRTGRAQILGIVFGEVRKILAERYGELEGITNKLNPQTAATRDSFILAVSSRVHAILQSIMPRWFFNVFDESLLDDLFNFAKEEGGRIWWLRLAIAASGFIFKFSWRRFERRKRTEK